MDFFKKLWPTPPEPPKHYTCHSASEQTTLEAIVQKTSRGFYEMHFLKYPDLQGRDGDFHTTHRYSSERPDCHTKMCVAAGREPRTIEKVEKFLIEYTEMLDTYIRTGIDIDTQLMRRN